ncbi:amidohydrolase family protein [Novosphingobium album (ex Hu et al. 2023)]|uniref:Amidohydrolase family protein n=1 Tax=Novosphingobium album (ex Hu et al. 2023) TaxID=2930093 RepID=A0ABT0B6T8_9SPHN|nr:amidohydrolase family protein [Novosphingobium album (ex Hu et al. 2023)]MCJ2180733.1 amidohydrolase family protein [Novosphingobium album (ex Hu et al. 2023)]
MSTLIRDVRIFDGTGTAAFAGSVLVDGERIASIFPGSEDDLPAADIVIEGMGMTLMPGMVDAHTHLTWASSLEKIYHQFILPPEELEAAAWRNARVLLDHGFTSLYSAGALGDRIEPDLTAAIEAGQTPGPRLVPSTLERSPEGAEGVETGDVFNGRGPDAMKAFVAYCKDEGVKSIKLVVSGEDALKPGSAKDVLYTRDEMMAAGEAAREAGLWIACHVYSPEAIGMALDAGARILYHGSFADEAAIERMAAEKDHFFYAPGPGVSVAALEASPPPHVDMAHMKASAAERMEREGKLVPELKKRGVRVLIGGDYGFPFNPHGRNSRDLEHFVKHFGFTPAEALQAATQYGGELMGLDVGLVREGYLADLLLVDGDPAQDVSILQDKDRLKMIMKGGALYKAPAEAETAG